MKLKLTNRRIIILFFIESVGSPIDNRHLLAQSQSHIKGAHMRTLFLRITLAAFFSVSLSVGSLSQRAGAPFIAHAQAPGCSMLGDPILVSETESCTETMAMFGCFCHSEWGVPFCAETHFCLFTACSYGDGGFSFSVYCV